MAHMISSNTKEGPKETPCSPGCVGRESLANHPWQLQVSARVAQDWVLYVRLCDVTNICFEKMDLYALYIINIYIYIIM